VIEISKDKYSSTKYLLDSVLCDRTFAYSIIENRQKGCIYVDNEHSIKNAIFWHFCGYGLLAEVAPNEDSIVTLLGLMQGKHQSENKNLILQVYNTDQKNRIEHKTKNDSSIRVGQRLIFRFNRSRFIDNKFPIPNGYEIVKIDEQLLRIIKGNVVPSFSWSSSEEFNNNGIGFCLLKGEEIVNIAFTSFVGYGQIDIGIETPPKHRNNGYARITASRLIKYCLDNNLDPIWGCVKNISSIKVALSLGFELIGENNYYYFLCR
jgi:hypothetical protein